MQMPEYLPQLIEEASKAAGSDYKLAAELGVTRFTVSNWKAGRKSCPVGDQVLMAQIAGLEAEKWAARAIVGQYEGKKAERLARALKNLLPAIGAAIVTSGCTDHASAGLAHFIRCIKASIGMRFGHEGKPLNRCLA